MPTNSLVVEAAQEDMERPDALAGPVRADESARPSARIPAASRSAAAILHVPGPADDRPRSASPSPVDDLAKMDNAELRKLIGILSGQLQELRTRVNQLELDARRVVAAPPAGLGRDLEDLRARVSKLEADAQPGSRR